MRNPGEKCIRLGLLILVSLALGSVSAVRAQDVSIDLWVDPDIKAFFISDFHVDDPSRNPLIMTLNITNNLGLNVPVCLKFTARTGEGIVLTSGETNPFNVPPGGLQLTSQDISEVGGEYSLRTFELGPDDVLRDLRDATLATGMIPSGTYTFLVELYQATQSGCLGTLITLAYRDVEVTNPFNLELLLPGQPFGEEGPEEAQFPTFQWVSEACDFDLTVCQALPEQVSAEEVMENEPVYVGSIEDDCVPVHSAVYPATAEELAPGESYCWQVTSLVPTSGGTEERDSEILCFKVRSTEPTGTAENDILFYLQAIADKLAEYGITMPNAGTDVVIELDGGALTDEEYMVWLGKVASGKVQITNIKAR